MHIHLLHKKQWQNGMETNGLILVLIFLAEIVNGVEKDVTRYTKHAVAIFVICLLYIGKMRFDGKMFVKSCYEFI